MTRLLAAWREGDASAGECLMPLVYGELRRLAVRHLRHERADHTLQPTALVNEAFLKLLGQRNLTWQNRAHFIGLAAQLMRRILVDYARSHAAGKRGGGARHVFLDEALLRAQEKAVDVVALDDALMRLTTFDPLQGRLVELRFYGGLTIEETAEVLGVSPATVKREWNFAKAWLHRALTGEANA